MKGEKLWVGRETSDSADVVLCSVAVCNTICKGSIHTYLLHGAESFLRS